MMNDIIDLDIALEESSQRRTSTMDHHNTPKRKSSNSTAPVNQSNSSTASLAAVQQQQQQQPPKRRAPVGPPPPVPLPPQPQPHPTTRTYSNLSNFSTSSLSLQRNVSTGTTTTEGGGRSTSGGTTAGASSTNNTSNNNNNNFDDLWDESTLGSLYNHDLDEEQERSIGHSTTMTPLEGLELLSTASAQLAQRRDNDTDEELGRFSHKAYNSNNKTTTSRATNNQVDHQEKLMAMARSMGNVPSSVRQSNTTTNPYRTTTTGSSDEEGSAAVRNAVTTSQRPSQQQVRQQSIASSTRSEDDTSTYANIANMAYEDEFSLAELVSPTILSRASSNATITNRPSIVEIKPQPQDVANHPARGSHPNKELSFIYQDVEDMTVTTMDMDSHHIMQDIPLRQSSNNPFLDGIDDMTVTTHKQLDLERQKRLSALVVRKNNVNGTTAPLPQPQKQTERTISFASSFRNLTSNNATGVPSSNKTTQPTTAASSTLPLSLTIRKQQDGTAPNKHNKATNKPGADWLSLHSQSYNNERAGSSVHDRPLGGQGSGSGSRSGGVDADVTTSDKRSRHVWTRCQTMYWNNTSKPLRIFVLVCLIALAMLCLFVGIALLVPLDGLRGEGDGANGVNSVPGFPGGGGGVANDRGPDNVDGDGNIVIIPDQNTTTSITPTMSPTEISDGDGDDDEDETSLTEEEEEENDSSSSTAAPSTMSPTVMPTQSPTTLAPSPSPSTLSPTVTPSSSKSEVPSSSPSSQKPTMAPSQTVTTVKPTWMPSTLTPTKSPVAAAEPLVFYVLSDTYELRTSSTTANNATSSLQDALGTNLAIPKTTSDAQVSLEDHLSNLAFKLENDSQGTFLVHLGGFMENPNMNVGAGYDCINTTQRLEEASSLLRQSPIPYIALPGDGDWYDCVSDPEKHLEVWRQEMILPQVNKQYIELPNNDDEVVQVERDVSNEEHFAMVIDGVLLLGLNVPSGHVIYNDMDYFMLMDASRKFFKDVIWEYFYSSVSGNFINPFELRGVVVMCYGSNHSNTRTFFRRFETLVEDLIQDASSSSSSEQFHVMLIYSATAASIVSPEPTTANTKQQLNAFDIPGLTLVEIGPSDLIEIIFPPPGI